MIPTAKQCKDCQEVKSLEQFTLIGKRWFNSYCRTCVAVRGKIWRAAHPERCQEASWRGKGINCDVVQYKQMHDSQEGLCWVCRKPEPASGRRFAVDHDHDTGEIRGLLCVRCNTALEWFLNYRTEFSAYLRKD